MTYGSAYPEHVSREGPREGHGERRALLPAAWFGVGALLLWRMVVLPWPYLDDRLSDFSAYWGAAGQLIRGLSPYTHVTYIYPPVLAILVSPLALLSYVLARRVFFVASVLVLLAAAALLARKQTGWKRLWPLCSLAVIGSLSENLVLGQVQPLLLLLVVVAFLAASRRRQGIEGAALGLAAAIKLWPVLLLVSPATGRRWRALGVAAVVAAVGISSTPLVGLLPGPTVPSATDYVFGTPAVLNGSVPGLATRWASRPAPGERTPESWYRAGGAPQTLVLSPPQRAAGAAAAAITLLGGLAVLAAGGLLGTHSRSEEELRVLRWCGVLTLALLVVPVSWYHYQLLQWLTLTIGVPVLWRHARGLAAGAALAVLAASWTAPTIVKLAVGAGGWAGASPGRLFAASLVIPTAGVVTLTILAVGARRVVKSPKVRSVA